MSWTRGGTADFVAADDERITVRSSTPSAPGSRPEGSLEDGRSVRIKVHRCRRLTDDDANAGGSARDDDACFEIEGRLIDATRAMRDHVAALVSREPSL